MAKYDWEKDVKALKALQAAVKKYSDHLDDAVAKAAHIQATKGRGKGGAGSYKDYRRDFHADAWPSEWVEGVLVQKRDVIQRLDRIINPIGVDIEANARQIMQEFKKFYTQNHTELKEKLTKRRQNQERPKWENDFLNFLDRLCKALGLKPFGVAGAGLHSMFEKTSKKMSKVEAKARKAGEIELDTMGDHRRASTPRRGREF